MAESITNKIDISDALASMKNNSTKYTVYKELDNELREDLNEKTEDLIYIIKRNVDWKIILLVLFASLVIFIVILSKINQYLILQGKYNEYGLQMISFFMFFIVINYVIFIISLIHYFKISQTVNFRGSKGPQGDRGDNGEDTECNICQAKPQLLKRPNKEVFESEVIMPDLEQVRKSEEKEQIFNPPQILGISEVNLNKKCTYLDKYNCQYREETIPKGVVGVVSNVTEDNETYIDNIQYIIRNNKDEIELLNGNNGIWGDLSKKNNIKELQCPKNSSIYKMEALYKLFTEDVVEENTSKHKGGLVGLSIGCKDMITGLPVDLKENYIGKKPDISSGEFKYDVVYCDGKGYFSEVGGNYDSSGLSNLVFKKCI